jgi:hypothetical protein
MSERLALAPITLRQAQAFVVRWHRHSRPVRGAKAAIAATLGARIVGVAIIGRPVSAGIQARGVPTVEITRVATDGTRNACSFLYGAARQLGRALGYRHVVTYTRPDESGASLRAAGFVVAGTVPGASWSRPARPRVDYEPWQGKLRWESAA